MPNRSPSKLVVIIPTYNENDVIAQTISRVVDVLSELPLEAYILIFDSSSTDGTQDIVRQLQQQFNNLLLQVEPIKTGLGSSYLQAMRYALDHLNADIIIEFDADLSHQPHYIPIMLEKMKHYDVVIGSRYVSGGHVPDNWAWNRKVLSWLGNLTSRCLLTPKYKDWTSGFRVSHHVALRNALPPQSFLTNDYAYKLHLLWSMHKTKARIHEHPIDFIDRKHNKSKLPANSIVDGLRVIALLRLQQLKHDIFSRLKRRLKQSDNNRV